MCVKIRLVGVCCLEEFANPERVNMRNLKPRNLTQFPSLVREELGFEPRQSSPTVCTSKDLVCGLCIRKDLVWYLPALLRSYLCSVS